MKLLSHNVLNLCSYFLLRNTEVYIYIYIFFLFDLFFIDKPTFSFLGEIIPIPKNNRIKLENSLFTNFNIHSITCYSKQAQTYCSSIYLLHISYNADETNLTNDNKPIRPSFPKSARHVHDTFHLLWNMKVC